jgi:hypothetical protein
MSYVVARVWSDGGRWRVIGLAALAVAAALVLFRPVTGIVVPTGVVDILFRPAASTAFPTGTAVVRELPPTSSWEPGMPFGLPDCSPVAGRNACVARYTADRAAAAAAVGAARAELARLDPDAAPEPELATAQARLDAARLALDAAERRERAALRTAGR